MCINYCLIISCLNVSGLKRFMRLSKMTNILSKAPWSDCNHCWTSTWATSTKTGSSWLIRTMLLKRLVWINMFILFIRTMLLRRLVWINQYVYFVYQELLLRRLVWINMFFLCIRAMVLKRLVWVNKYIFIRTILKKYIFEKFTLKH